jgi:hypothetical protein
MFFQKNVSVVYGRGWQAELPVKKQANFAIDLAI